MKHRIDPYNLWHDLTEQRFIMPKRRMQLAGKSESFGERLARLRQEAGLSQRDLAAEVNISQRMVAYYEKQTAHPPTHLLAILAKALGVSSDQLLGIKEVKSNGRTRDNRLWRRFSQVEQLPQSQRKQIVQILDAFLERDKLKKAS
jgi:transcriptional regulator with XRE-family HTH domain